MVNPHPMETKVLQPRRTPLNIKGRISYRECDQAWNLIKLKRELLNEFADLKEKRSRFSYQMMFYRTCEELEAYVKKIKKDGSALPILLFLEKERVI